MLKTVNTKFLLKEIDTEGHHPMHFLCDDGNKYYSKYLVRHAEEHSLLYELIGTVLCNHHNIPTPEVALVKVSADSYNKKDIPNNRKRLKPGVICFGSKEIENADLFTELSIPESKHDFNLFLNPDDIIKMSLFDLWILNTDRKDGRYNFIFKNEGRGKRIYAIDHAFAFGGAKQKHFAPHDSIFTQEMLISSRAMMAFIQYFDKTTLSETIDGFFYLCNDESKKTVIELFHHTPQCWGISEALQNRIIDFLFNIERLKKLKTCVQQSLLRK